MPIPEEQSRTSGRSAMRCVRLLLGCTSAAELLGTVLAEGPGWITGEGSALYLLDSAGMLRLTASHGLPDWAHERYGLVDPAGELPAAMALRLRRPYLLGPEHTSVDYPNRNSGMGTGMVAVVTLPLMVDERAIGVLALALAHRGTVPPRDLDVLETIAGACAHRLHHLLDHVSDDVDPRREPPEAGPDPASAHPLLSLAVRAAGHGAFARDLVTGESYWDAAAFAVAGQPVSADGAAPELERIVHPEDLPDVRAALVEALASGGRYRIGYRVLRRGGEVARVEESGEVMLDVHGRPVRIAGLLADVDHRGERPAGPRHDPAGARTALLLSLTRALSRAVTVRDVTAAVTDVARPAFGAASIVLDLVDEGRLLPVSHTVYGGPRRAELTRLADLSEGVMQHSPARSAPLFSEPGGRPTSTDDPAAWAVLPLVASGRQVGSCLITFAAERVFSREDRTLYSAFAGILAQSLERARLYDTHHHRAGELQRAMLPRTLPRLPGIASAARYLPSTEGMQVGGDWYDLLKLPDGRIGLVIGDVQGHNAEATAVMGQLRSGLRAYATDGHDPAATLARTSRLLAELDTELFATCLYLTLDPADGSLTAARAGHPAPVRIAADATAVELELPGGPPLGVDPAQSYPLATGRLAGGETLLAYTDGLVEDREEDYDESVQRMLGGLELWARQTGPGRVDPMPALERLADLLTLNVTERRSRPDDVALLLLHRMPSLP
ncbi:SpoIIE family protein phosphatase [Kitasatospora aureofaciens]|uniref:SpoIIE family protein phosphatase n=1 Tax=Kitasatospora aureofaciens TaxID=1894 RepID=UPI001DA4BA27|nr:SpoIIE family protein phosphatase [Kitasatospora aureofaciens]HJD84821.1 SpoIIE family protein phosphatase [Kitasatospora aureofaciens]